MPISPIHAAALEYLELGFSVIPIRPGPEKKPFIAWTEFQRRRPTEDEIDAWFARWPTANVAILTGSISGILVVDGDGEIGSRWISENLPKTSVYAKTGRNAGCHCFYRIPPGSGRIPNKVGWRPKVDIRAEGGYVVAAPSVHHTGNVYQLIYREGLRGWEELAELDPYAMDAAAKPAAGQPRPVAGNLCLDLSKTPLPSDAFEPAGEGNRNDRLASSLGKVLRSGMTDQQAWEYAVTWNAQWCRPPLPEREVAATFKSILRLHRLGEQTEAKNQPAAAQPATEVNRENHPAEKPAPVVAAPEPEPEIISARTDSYPVECLQPGGLMQEIMTYVEKSSSAHKPIFALSAAIALVGNLIGQKLQTETGLRTNMYCVSIGYSGCGKNASHSAISAILRGGECRRSMGPTDTASGAAVLRWLTTDEHQVTLLTLDEIGMLLKGLKNPGSPMCELPRILTKIFSECDRPYSKSYADAKLNITVAWHHLSMYASSTPAQFWGNLSEADAVSGFLARLLIFEARDEADRPRQVVASDVPASIAKQVAALWSIQVPIDLEQGDMARVPIPIVVPRSAAARAVFAPWSDWYWEKRNQHREDEALSAVFGRAAEHCAKLALIHAASLAGPKAKEVGLESVEWAIRTTDACIGALLGGIRSSIAANAHHADQQRLLKLLRDSGGAASMRTVYRRLRLPVRQTNDLIGALVAAGEIRQEARASQAGPPSAWVALVPQS